MDQKTKKNDVLSKFRFLLFMSFKGIANFTMDRKYFLHGINKTTDVYICQQKKLECLSLYYFVSESFLFI